MKHIILFVVCLFLFSFALAQQRPVTPAQNAAAAEQKFNTMGEALDSLIGAKVAPAAAVKPYGRFPSRLALGDETDLRDLQGRRGSLRISAENNKSLELTRNEIYINIPEARWSYKINLSKSGGDIVMEIQPLGGAKAKPEPSINFNLTEVSSSGNKGLAVTWYIDMEKTRGAEHVSGWGSSRYIADIKDKP